VPPKRGDAPGSPKEAIPVRDVLDGLDKLLEHRVRLAVAVLLSRVDALSFSRLRELLGETDGNLGANLRRLEDAGYLAVTKEFIDRKPVSWYVLTAAGRAALASHVRALERITRAASLAPRSELSSELSTGGDP
jgi:DNA-binding MarR family transcriptional regulator